MLKIKRIFFLLIAILSLVFITSCDLSAILPMGFTVEYEKYDLCDIPSEKDVLELPSKLPTPKADGYEFVGWYYDEDFMIEAYGGDLIIEDTVLYALWNELGYTLSFVSEYGKQINPITNVNKIPTLPTPTDSECIFIGWYYDEDFLLKAKLNDPINEDTVLYAKWSEPTYTIHFISERGDIVQSITNVNQITILQELFADGYEFGGWYFDEQFMLPASVGMEINCDITLYAKWIKNSFDITFENNGHGEQIPTITDKYILPDVLPTLTEEGYKFIGWYYDQALTKVADSNDILKSNVTLYAKWEEFKYTVNFDLNGVEGSISPMEVGYNKEIIIPSCDISNAGYNFVGWNTKADGSGDAYESYTKVVNLTTEDSITLYAIWEKASHTLTIQFNNGASDLTLELLYGELIPSVNEPFKPNSEFEGWFTNIDGDIQSFTFGTATMPNHNLVVFAKYIGEITVTYIVSDETYASTTGYAGEAITTVIAPNVLGHSFNGWFMDEDFETPFNLVSFPENNTIIYGKTTPNQITISFNGNGQTSGSMAQQIRTYGSNVALNSNTFVKTGYKFLGWSTSSNSESVEYVDGYDKDIISEGSITLYAVWERLVFNVVYDNNGHGTKPQELKGVCQLPNQLPILVEEGFIFIGWYYDQTFTNQAKVNDELTKNTTLYAKWEQEKVPTPEPTEKIVDSIIYDDFQIHFLELGNAYSGDSTYIKAGDIDILIDAGSRTSSATTIKSYVDKYCTDGKLEYVIATHGDQDHIAGFVGSSGSGILYKYEIGTIIDFPKTTKTTQVYNNYVTARNNAVSKGAIHYTAAQCYNNTDGAQRTYQLADGISMSILYNYYYFNTSSDENDYSVCAMFTYKDFNFMFTGDLEEKGENKMAAYYDGSTAEKTLPKVELFKAGHHGSKTSTNDSLLKLIQPEIVCVCCCAGGSEYTAYYQNTFPTQAMIDRVAKYTDRVYVTTMYDIKKNDYASLNGNIIISSNGKSVGVSATNNITKLKDSTWFNTTIYANSSGQYCSGTGKKDYYTSATSGTTPRPQRVWPS